MSQTITIVYADSSEAYCLGLQSLIKDFPEIELLATASNEAAIKKAVADLQPRILVFELDIPGMAAPDICHWLSHNHPDTRTLVFTMHQSMALTKAALDAGVHGHLRKNCKPPHLAAAIQTISYGATCYGPECNELNMSRNRHLQKMFVNRMLCKVLCLMCKGKETPEIAAAIHRSPGTVNGYRRSISALLGTTNPFLQAIYAINLGLVDPEDCLGGLGKR